LFAFLLFCFDFFVFCFILFFGGDANPAHTYAKSYNAEGISYNAEGISYNAD
jgi:hypothetical protein